MLIAACEGGNIDAGRDLQHGSLPVDERNPVIVANDSATDNWTGEYAMLLANSGGPPLVGIIVNPSAYWPDLAANVDGWKQMIAAARASGLRNIPDVTGQRRASRWSGPPTARSNRRTPEHVGGREADRRSVRAAEPAVAAAGGRHRAAA